jgi:cell division septum initiation protein DivIVA
MSEAEKMAERLEAGAFDFNADGPCWPGDDMAEAAALIRRLQAENADLMEQLAIRSESGMAKDMQEIMKANNALHDENARLKQLVDLADALRAAQRAYMADRGNDQLGRAVANAAKSYDGLRGLGGVRSDE